MRRLPQTLCLLAFVAVFISSCRKPSGANWDIDLSLPIVTSDLNIENFAGDTLFKSDANHLLHLKYDREVVHFLLDSLLQLPDTTIVKQFPDPGQFFPPVTLGPGQSVPFLAPADLKFDISNGVQITRADIHAGILNVSFSNSTSQPIDLVYQIPGATRAGSALTIAETIPPGEKTLVKQYDLSGYSFNMRGESNKLVNTITQHYSVTVNAKADSVHLTPGQGAKIELSYSRISPAYVEGYFGQQQVEIAPDTAHFSLIKNFQANGFMLDDVSMTFRIMNEFGADFRASLANIRSLNTPQNKSVTLSNSKLSAINLNRAAKGGGGPIATEKLLDFNAGNSNIVPFISNLPDQLAYQGTVSLNPPPIENTGFSDFAFYNTGLRIFADIDIPLRFSSENFRLESNTATDFRGVEQLDRVNTGSLVINAVNGFPFAAKLQAYMVDEYGVVIDSLLAKGSGAVAAGVLNSNNDVVEAVPSSIVLPLDRPRIEKLKLCRTVKVVSYLLMPKSPPSISIYDSYALKVNIVAEMNYNVGVKR